MGISSSKLANIGSMGQPGETPAPDDTDLLKGVEYELKRRTEVPGRPRPTQELPLQLIASTYRYLCRWRCRRIHEKLTSANRQGSRWWANATPFSLSY